MRLAIITLPYPGHLRPLLVLARNLATQGHQVHVLSVPDAGASVRQAGFAFLSVGQDSHPIGSLATHTQALAGARGLAGADVFLGFVAAHGEAVLRDGPAQLAAAGIEALVVDQVEPAGMAVGELLGLPTTVACAAFALHRGPGTPPIWSHRSPARSLLGRACMRLLHRLGDGHVARRHLGALRRFRRLHGLAERPPEALPFASSPLAELAQEPAILRQDWPGIPELLHWCGPFRDAGYDDGAELHLPDDERPLVFASLGSLQQQRHDLLHSIAEAAERVGARLVLADGGALAGQSLPGGTIVVPHVRQRALIPRCRAVLSHGGLNTVLDTLAAGVPLALVPLAFEQPAIASRVAAIGAAAVLRARPTTARLAELLHRTLTDAQLRQAARRAADACPGDGARRAATVITQALRTLRPVSNGSPTHATRPGTRHRMSERPVTVG